MINTNISVTTKELFDARFQLFRCKKCLANKFTKILSKKLDSDISIDDENMILWQGKDEIQTRLRIYLSNEKTFALGFYIEILIYRRLSDSKKSCFGSIAISNDYRCRLFVKGDDNEYDINNITKLLNIYCKFINNKDDILEKLLKVDLKYYDNYFAVAKNLDELEISNCQNNDESEI